MRAPHSPLFWLVGLALSGVAFRCHGAPPQSAGAPRYEIGREVEAEGTVAENVLDCRMDGACYIRLTAAGGEVTVVYATPRGTPCRNEKAAREGMEIHKGERIRVFARVSGPAEFSTCGDPKYFFVRVDDR